MTVIHQTTGMTATGYTLTRIYHDPRVGILRVRVERDFYPHQSTAVAEVLSRTVTRSETGDVVEQDVSWTALAHNPGSNWHSGAIRRHTSGMDHAEIVQAVDHLATGLHELAVAVLSAGQP